MQKLEMTYEETAGVSAAEIRKKSDLLSDYVREMGRVVRSRDFSAPEASLTVLDDEDMRSRVADAAARFRADKLACVVFVGIGGSLLGTKAVYDALKTPEHTPVFFLDTINPRAFAAVRRFLDERVSGPEELLIHAASKSGATTETIVNLELLYAYAKERFGEENVRERIVVATGEDSPLWNTARRKGFEVFAIPKKVGGRYSVFSAAHLFPLAAAGFDISALTEGARSMRDRCLFGGGNLDPARVGAAALFAHMEKGVVAHNSFFFNAELESVGKWGRQLTGESVGKKENTDGEEVRAGVIPLVSVGSTDLHSMAQLYLGGPRNIFTAFVHARETEDVLIPERAEFCARGADFSGKTTGEIMRAILDGTQNAYARNGVPFVRIEFPAADERSLGEYFQMRMMEVMYLAKLMNVDAFNQPSVEEYKRETRNILGLPS